MQMKKKSQWLRAMIYLADIQKGPYAFQTLDC